MYHPSPSPPPLSLTIPTTDPSLTVVRFPRDQSLLVVDDDEAIRVALAAIFADEGYTQVRLAASGEEGLVLCKERLPDLLLLDYTMRGMNGGQFLDILIERGWRVHLYVVLFTAWSAGHINGVAPDYRLSKPFEIESLLRIVEWHPRMEQ